MPMVMIDGASLEARAFCAYAMGIIEPDQSRPFGVMQRERVAQPVRPFRRRCRAPDLELDPVALFEVMDASIERQQKFKRMFVGDRGPLSMPIMIGYHIMDSKFKGCVSHLTLATKSPYFSIARFVPKVFFGVLNFERRDVGSGSRALVCFVIGTSAECATAAGGTFMR
jgi:hypothetical protein